MPNGIIFTTEIDPTMIDIIHCPLKGNKGAREKSLWRSLSLALHRYTQPLPPNQDWNKNKM